MKDFEFIDFDRDTLRRYTGTDTDVVVPDCFRKCTYTQPRQNTLIVLLSAYLHNLSTCCRLLQLRVRRAAAG